MSIFTELRRRNVIRIAIAYLVTAWLVAQVAELALESFGTPEWVMKTLLLLLAIGLPFALIFAWAFEMTPEGIKREKDVDRSQSITPQTGRKLNVTIIATLVVALILAIATRDVQFGGADPVELQETAADSEKSIAVLPFVNMSDDPDNEYFSDGISEELLNVLVKVEGLRVASRTSAFSFKGKDTPIPEIAEALKVEHVLEGSVRKAGDTVRITAQLIDVRTDSHLWSDTYDRKFEDIFVIQDEISAHIVDALKVALGTGEVVRTAVRPTDNLTAYEDYLKARHFWQRRGGDNIQKAIDLFTRATEADPEFARAWSGLGAAHLTMPNYSSEPSAQHYTLALSYAHKALSLDPSIADAHATIADLLRFNRRWSDAERHYLKAIELEPKNPTGYLWYAEQLASTGRRDATLAYASKALELDPFHPGTNSMVSIAYAMNDDIEQTLKSSRFSWDLGHELAFYRLLDYNLLLGNVERVNQLIDEDALVFGEVRAAEERDYFGRYLDAANNPEKVDSFLAWSSETPNSDLYWNVVLHARFSRVDEIFDLVSTHALLGNDWMVIWRPDLKALRTHPRFGEILESAGLIEFWDEVGWPEQCSRDGDAITCR